DDGLCECGLGREMTFDGVHDLGDVEPHGAPPLSGHTLAGPGWESIQVRLGTFGRLRAREQMALSQPAPGPADDLQVGRCLEALGHHLDAEPTAEADHHVD